MRLSFVRTALVGASLLLQLAAADASATSIVPMTVEQIAADSDVIVDGELIQIDSRFVGRRILTFATLRVDRVLKGEVAAKDGGARTVTFAVLGGVVGGVGQRVPGAPVPVIHARYVIALSKPDGPEGARHIIGFSQGLWRVDPEGHVLVVDPKASVPPPRVPLATLEARFGKTVAP